MRTPIEAKEGTYTNGRGSFYMHGGVTPGSAGCIDLTDQNNDFHDWLSKQKRGRQLIVPLESDFPPPLLPDMPISFSLLKDNTVK